MRRNPVGKVIHLRCNVIDLSAFERDCSLGMGFGSRHGCFELHYS